MKSFSVLAARLDQNTNKIEVVKEVTNDDNTVILNLHIFPIGILESKSAELEIEDLDELIDIVLYEPFYEEGLSSFQMTAEESRNIHRERIAGIKNKSTFRVNGHDVAKSKARMQVAGVNQKYVDAANDNPYELIKRECPFDREVIKVSREYIEGVRKKLKKLKKPRENFTRLSGQARAVAAKKALSHNDITVETGKAKRDLAAKPKKNGELKPVVLGKNKKRR